VAQDLLEQSPAFGGTPVEPAGLDLGYAAQDRLWRLRQARLGGYKLGLTTLKAQAATGASGPVAGRLADTDLIRGQVALAVRPGHLRIIEAELLFELGRDLDGRAGTITPEDVFAATRAFHAGIEVCDARLFPDDDATLAQIVADNVYADKVVIGERLTVAALDDLNDIQVHLTGDGQPVITGSTAQVLGNPALAVAWLANHLAALGGHLRAGMVIASGSCTGMVEAPLGVTMRADFAGRATAMVVLNPYESC
jgi:2-keto-4-pentenoate hydratase